MIASFMLFYLFEAFFDERLLLTVRNSNPDIAVTFQQYQYEISNSCKDYENIEVSSGKLRLSENRFENLPNLQTLRIHNVQIYETSPGCFTNLPKLTNLLVEETNLATLPNRVLPTVPSLQRVTFTRNNLQEIETKAFDNLVELEYVNLGSNKLTKIHPNWFRNCPKLRTLNLRDNDIELLEHAGFKQVETSPSKPITLILSYNRIAHLEGQTFANLEHIDLLMLDNNNLKVLGPSAFRRVKTIRKLDLTNNRLQKYDFNLFNKCAQLHISGSPSNCQVISENVGANQTVVCDQFY